MSSKRVEIKVTGAVQGVFFRAGVKTEAEKLGLTGWVRNENDGSVKIIAEGEEENLQKLVEWARLGSSGAEVKDVEITRQEATGEFPGFSIKI